MNIELSSNAHWPKCPRCRRHVPWLINLGICGRCRGVAVESGWVVHNPETYEFEYTELGKTLVNPAEK